MTPDERQQLATERAEAYAPKPTGGSIMAGVCVATVVLLGWFAVSRFYGWALREHLLIALVSAPSGFLVGLVGYKRLAHLSRTARQAERRRIDDDQDRCDDE